LSIALAVVRVFVSARLEQIQLGLEAFHVRTELGDLAFLLLDGSLERRYLVTPSLMSHHLVVIPTDTPRPPTSSRRR